MALTSLKQLFGGAMTMILPNSFIDASDIRQIPDNQEVFLSATSDVSFIIEILERVDINDLSDAARFHFDSIAHDNDAQSHTVESVTIPDDKIDTSITPVIVEGTQLVTKFNRTVPDDVQVSLALYRLKDKNVDIVLSANIPIIQADGSSIDKNDILAAKNSFAVAAQSLKILDYNLFT